MAFYRNCGGVVLQEQMQKTKKSFELKNGAAFASSDVIKTKSNCLNIGEILRACVINYIDKSKPKNTALDYIKIIIKNVERFLINDERSRVSFAISMIGCGVGWPDIADVFKIYRAYFTKLQNFDKICDVIVVKTILKRY